MKRIDDIDLIALSRKCQGIMAMPMKEIAQFPYKDFSFLYYSIQPTISTWTYSAANALNFPYPKNIVVRCPSSRVKWAAHVVGNIIEFNLRTVFYADSTWLKGCIIHELCHLYIHDHTKKFWELYEQKIKEARIVNETYYGWKEGRDKEENDPFMYSPPGIMHIHRQKFNCMLNTFFYKGYTLCYPAKIDYKLLHNDT